MYGWSESDLHEDTEQEDTEASEGGGVSVIDQRGDPKGEGDHGNGKEEEEKGVGSKVVLKEEVELEGETGQDEKRDGDEVGKDVGDEPGQPVDPVLRW